MEGETINLVKEENLLEENTIVFSSAESRNEILKLCENGDIFVNGRLAENDKEVVEGLREFLRSVGILK